MGKITYIDIAGKRYPMSFSLGASKKIAGMKGGTKNLMEFLNKDGNDDKKIDIFLEILEVLIAQGCAYKNYFEKNIPKPNNAPVKNGSWVPLTIDELQTVIEPSEIERIGYKIKECIEKSQKKDVSAKSTSKNTKAAQE